MRMIDADALQDEVAVLLERIEDAISDAPTIEPKHGRWLNEELFDRGIYFNTQGDCSECGHHGMTTNYCPFCGAKMDEPSEPDYTITCADAPMTYTSDCSKCANNTCKSVTKPTANCMGFREVEE